MNKYMPPGRAALLLVAAILAASPVMADKATERERDQAVDHAVETAQVLLDDHLLFEVRGIKAYPAKERARDIADRVRAIAADHSIPAGSIAAVESRFATNIVAGRKRIVSVYDADAVLEGIRRELLVEAYVFRLQEAIESYRRDRSAERIMSAIGYAVLATIGILGALFLLARLFRWLIASLEKRYRRRIQEWQDRTHKIIQAERVAMTLLGLVKSIRLVIMVALVYVYVLAVLTLFPWTRLIARRMSDDVVGQLGGIGSATLAVIPDLVFIVIIVLFTRFALKLVRLYFSGLERGTMAIANFDPAWAQPTYKVIRLVVIALVAVIIYPHIPGSDSAAFKGISVFLGVIASLGSTSVIANIIAGYSLIYRRTFRIGDRVQIGDIRGDVMASRLQATHLWTVKNEEVIIPNSTILGSDVINYSSLARDKGLILHTTVTIGYDVPWRQVQALLLKAAANTDDLLRDPAPFVLQASLDDHYVSYELNAFTNEAKRMMQIYSDLHRNILDVFNEYGVQIMSPHYEGDPPETKVVPKERWYEPPAEPGGQTNESTKG